VKPAAAAQRATVGVLASANPTAIAMARFADGEALADLDPTGAAAALEEARQRAQDVGNRYVAGTALTATVALRSRHDPPDPALALFRDAVKHWQSTGNRALIVTTLRNLVIVLARTGRDQAPRPWPRPCSCRLRAGHTAPRPSDRDRARRGPPATRRRRLRPGMDGGDDQNTRAGPRRRRAPAGLRFLDGMTRPPRLGETSGRCGAWSMAVAGQ
jgi:hypothetical protein